jgi:excisionase family DNA binding protein
VSRKSQQSETITAPRVVPKASHAEDPYLTFSDVAKRLGVSNDTVRRYAHAKLIRAEWRGPLLCIRESALAEFQGKHYEPPEEK